MNENNTPEVRAICFSPLEDPKRICDLLESVNEGICSGFDPKRVTIGTSGSYIFYDNTGKETAIFKPCDEDQHAPNNPRGNHDVITN